MEPMSPDKPRDPASIWWGTTPKSEPPPPITPLPPRWEWRYSRWFGIMYGPIPVGLIIGIPILLAIYF